jgi:hypothetical protein
LESVLPPAPVFVTNQFIDPNQPPVWVWGIADSSCLISDQYGGNSDDSGLQTDPIGMTVSPSKDLTYTSQDLLGGIILSAREMPSATATIAGPQGNMGGGLGDPRPVSTPTVTISATHFNQDIVTNYTNDPKDITGTSTYASSFLQGGQQLAIANDRGSVSVTFTAHFDMTPGGQVMPQLDLRIGQQVGIFVNGSGATTEYLSSGLVSNYDYYFGNSPTDDFSDTLAFNVEQGDPLPVTFSSSLWSSPVGVIQPGIFQVNSHFSWTLTMVVQPNP